MKRGVDYIGVGVGAALFNTEGKLFLARRGPKAKNEVGKWDCPGGGVEYGETCAAAVRREIYEEHAIDIEVVELLGICDHIITDENQHWVSPTYVCKIIKGEPKICEPEKCDAMGWFTLEEASKLELSVTTRGDIETLMKKYPSGYPL